jgi:hypothetical protein
VRRDPQSVLEQLQRRLVGVGARVRARVGARVRVRVGARVRVRVWG